MDPTERASHFEFGKNWLSYSRIIDDDRIAEAELSLQRLLQLDLRGKSFLDIGSGSGLFSLAALRQGASPLEALDIDENSVAATRHLLEARAPSGAKWHVAQGSILDPAVLTSTFDVVYSWGVLHHTGKMWQAIRNAAQRVRPGGHFAIALYQKTYLCSVWKIEKRLYTQHPSTFAPVANAAFKGAWFAAQLVTGRNPVARIRSYKSSRGMSWSHDVHDWLGGYPYESASPEEVAEFVNQLGFEMLRANHFPRRTSGLFGSGCAEYVFRRTTPT